MNSVSTLCGRAGDDEEGAPRSPARFGVTLTRHLRATHGPSSAHARRRVATRSRRLQCRYLRQRGPRSLRRDTDFRFAGLLRSLAMFPFRQSLVDVSLVLLRIRT